MNNKEIWFELEKISATKLTIIFINKTLIPEAHDR